MLGDAVAGPAHGASTMRAMPICVQRAAAVGRRAGLHRVFRGVQRRDRAPSEILVRRPDAGVEDIHMDVGAPVALPGVGVVERKVALVNAVKAPGGRRLLDVRGVHVGTQWLCGVGVCTPRCWFRGEHILVLLHILKERGTWLRQELVESSGRGVERNDGQTVGWVARETHIARRRHSVHEAFQLRVGPACWHLKDPSALLVNSQCVHRA
mmetsp:Transcript_25040/g.68806  ORF Transcript_25040/g.68806 Transcript_25040/m.68806 type:complete len:210 (-) Transcript_25040:346-975(-)